MNKDHIHYTSWKLDLFRKPKAEDFLTARWYTRRSDGLVFYRAHIFRLQKLHMKVGYEKFVYIVVLWLERGALYEVPEGSDCDSTFLRCPEEVIFVDHKKYKFYEPPQLDYDSYLTASRKALKHWFNHPITNRDMIVQAHVSSECGRLIPTCDEVIQGGHGRAKLGSARAVGWEFCRNNYAERGG